MNPDEYGKMFELEDRYWWFVARRRLAMRLLERYVPRGAAMLDVGCGTGAVLTELNHHGQAHGIDVSELALRFSSGRGLLRIVQGDAEALPYRSARFDAVISLDTIEHIRDDEAAIGEVARVLQPGGVLLLNVPAFAWLWGPHDIALQHQRRYTRTQVRHLLESKGFQVERLSYSVFFLFPVVVVLRLLERRRKGPARVSLPSVSPGFNRLLIGLMDLESLLLNAVGLPWGSSVVAVARKR